MKDMASAYAAIVKSERQADGTLLVYGKATDDSVDIDQQICDAAWLDRAMPEWFKSGGNIREQHSSIAAGVAKEYEAKADGHYITTLVVDPVSVKKVETGVLKGFSIGIKSPRVVRDQKAANGRIIDGTIVEVSLVDRPANPNAKLIMAKSVDGESSLVQVEELVMNPVSAKDLVDKAKSIQPSTVKFDQAAYDTARRALAQLIMVEAKEMADEDSNEEMSLSHLLEAVHHLFEWYEGEEMEGETQEAGETTEVSEQIELAADSEKPADAEETKAEGDVCPDCGETEKMCKCNKAADGEDTPDDVEAEKSAEIEEPVKAEEPVEVKAEETTEDSSDKEDNLLNNEQIEEIVDKAVKSATESVRSEIDLIKSAKEAAEDRVARLETELAVAKSLAIAGGPKRSVIKAGQEVNELLTTAAIYSAKASSTTDQKLAEGYRQLAKEFHAKAAGSKSVSE